MFLRPVAAYWHGVAFLMPGVESAKRDMIVVPLGGRKVSLEPLLHVRIDLVDIRLCTGSSRAANDHRISGWAAEELKVRQRRSAR